MKFHARLAAAVAVSFLLHASAAMAEAQAGGTSPGIYFKRSQLEARPYLVTHVEPRYPTGVPPGGGSARIRLFINERGFVDRIAVVESTPHAKFGEAAANAFRTAQFAPGKRGGNAVKSQIVIEMEFPPLVPKTAK